MTDVGFNYENPLLRFYRGMNHQELVTIDGLTPEQADIVMKSKV
jgi:hypothetical protein